MGKLGYLEHPGITEYVPHQQGVLRYLPEVCEQAVHALLAQLLRELLGIWRSSTCKMQHLCSYLFHQVCSTDFQQNKALTPCNTILGTPQ